MQNKKNYSKFLEQESALLSLAMSMMAAGNKAIFPVDFIVLAAINRSLSHSKSIFNLIDNELGTAAVTLARLHLDTLLRLYSTWLVSDPHDYAMNLLEGEQTNRMKDRLGNKMTDSYLVAKYQKDHDCEWIERVYKTTSGFVHLSGKHIFQIFSLFSDEERSAHISIGSAFQLRDSDREELEEFILEVNERVAQLVAGWIATKNQKAT
jgi:hypothetical protein